MTADESIVAEHHQVNGRGNGDGASGTPWGFEDPIATLNLVVKLVRMKTTAPDRYEVVVAIDDENDLRGRRQDIALATLFGRQLSVLLLLAVAVSAAGAQVTAQAELRHGVAELRVGNPTTTVLHVMLELFRDATLDDGPVTLGDTISALISPRTFVLEPGDVQVVRIQARESVRVGELLRLATLFTPKTGEEVDAHQRMELMIRTRLITKVRAVSP